MPAAALTLDDLRRHAVARSLFTPTTLGRAIGKLGFVQADPIRAPARAQDLTLRHRVADYRAGDLDRRYPRMALEEDFFVNYGILPRAVADGMHPRRPRTAWSASAWKKAQAVLDFVREHGVVHPREVDAHFQHGKARNWFGGSTNASTQLLDGMHYRGLVRTARRDGGVRCYAARDAHEREPADGDATLDALADLVLNLYAPLPLPSYSQLVMHLRYGAPQWADGRRAALARALARHPQATVNGVCWIWPAGENPRSTRWQVPDAVRLLAPFDPVVWDRRRFELLWGWAYRFEAYVPAPQRVRGYYALPLLWRDRVIGWANVSRAPGGALAVQAGYVAGRAPREAAFRQALDEDVAALDRFLTPAA